MVGRAHDLRAGLERHLHDRVAAADQAWRAHRFDAHVAVRVDGEHVDARAAVRHVHELGERLLLAVVELDLRIAGEAAEVPLALDERIARREVLRETHQRVVDRRVPVRVILPHHFADDRRGFPVGPVAAEAHLVHAVEDPALHRLEAVADVRQRARDDDAHRVIEVRLAHLVLEVGADHPVVPRLLHHVRRCSLPSLCSACSRSTASRTRANAASVPE